MEVFNSMGTMECFAGGSAGSIFATGRQLPVRGFKSLLLPKALAWAVDYGSILRHCFLSASVPTPLENCQDI